MSHLAVLHLPDRVFEFETPKTRIRSGTLPSGITAKMDTFARHVAEGMSLADAYRKAFNTTNMKPKTVRDDASRLAQHSGVRAAIEAHRAEIEARNRMSALERGDRIWEQIWGLIEGESVPPAVKVKALDLAARLCSMLKRASDDLPLSFAAIETELGDRLKHLGRCTDRNAD
jgi:hypothetical protein